MSKSIILVSVLAIGSAVGFGTALCPPGGKCPFSKGEPVAAKTGETKSGCCATQTLLTSAKADETKSGGCAEKAQLTAAKADETKPGCCATQAKLASAQADQTKPCCAAKLAAAPAQDKPACCAAKLQLTAAGDPPKCGGALAAQTQEQCPISAACKTVLASMPKMIYRVGEQDTCCEMTAGKLAEEAQKPMLYVVGEETFEQKGPAMVKLTSLMEEEAKAMQTLRYAAGKECFLCPVTAQKAASTNKTPLTYRVAGMDFEDETQAKKALTSAKEAADAVKVAYRVDGQETPCCKTAGELAKTSGKEIVYVVNGQETACEVTHKYNLAQARLQAMIQAAAHVKFAQVEKAEEVKTETAQIGA